MAAGREDCFNSDDFHAVGDTILLRKFDYQNGAGDIMIRVLHVSNALRTVKDLKWVRVLGIEMLGDTESGNQGVFVVHVSALRRERTESAADA
jgi:hypothetical protein